MKTKKERFRAPILAVVASAILVLMVATVLGINWLQRQHIHEDVRASVVRVYELLQTELEEETQLMNSLIESVERDENLQKAWLAKDRDVLLGHSESLFEHIRSKYSVTHFYFHDLDKVCFLRVHNPPRYGDYIERFTLDGAVREGETVHGVELGPFGTFTLRIVHPWRINGELAGYIELGMEVENIIIEEEKQILDVELFYTVDKSYLDRAGWEEGMKMMGRSGNWDEFPNFVIVCRTMQQEPPELNEYLKRLSSCSDDEHLSCTLKMSFGDRTYQGGFFPLLEAGGRDVGDIIVINDITSKEAALRTLLVVLTVVCVVTAVLLFGFFYWYVGRVEQRLLKAREATTAEIKVRKKAYEKVQMRTAELSSTNEKLQEEMEQGSSAHTKLRQHIKELQCLYGLSKLIEKQKIPLEKIFQETPDLIRNVYRSPDITSVRITFEGIQYTTGNFEKSELSQYAHIMVRGKKAGGIEVYYLGEKAESGQAPFLQEERNLLDAVAQRLGRTAERKKAAEKLQLFRNLIDKSNDSIFVIEPEWGRFLDINDRACDNLGYTRKELLRMSFRDVDETTPDDPAWTQHVKEVRQKGYVVLESRLKRKDGTTFPVEMNVKLIEQEKGNYILVVAWDLTEQKLAEKRQAELFKEVKSANQELKDFAYIISHDLKAPLRGIKTLANWISTDYADKLDDNGRGQIDLLTRRVERMHNLIDGVLQYSRVGRTKEEKVKVNLNDLVAEVIDTVAPPENIEIIVENELPVIECEETRIIQVFQNLLSNAVKYMDKPQGQIAIGGVEENGFWKFSVTDNGPGIEEKHFERIFRIFQTLLPRDEFESTGVGLTVVKKIVELYGGKIWVESKLGEGCTFFFTLPKKEIEMGLKDAKLEANIVS